MKIEALHVGMKIRHPQYGIGTIKTIAEHTAEIRFDDGVKTISPEASGVEPEETQIAITGLHQPLKTLISDLVQATVRELGLEKPDTLLEDMGARWHKGRLVMHPADPTLQPKEVPIDVFFHKIVMMRNNFRVLEQKINGNDKLSDAEKVELQQYNTRCYCSMPTFNVLFRNKEDQFRGAAAA
jgi:hypothetical protein